MLLAGVDFTSRPSRRKPETVALGRAVAGGVELLRVERHASFDSLGQWLHSPGPWLAAFDFPFGLPRALVAGLGWPDEWLPLMRHYGALSRPEIRSTFRAWCNARAAGDKFAHRACDRVARSSPSMKWVQPPVAYMMHAGVGLLIDAGVDIPRLHRGDPTRVAVEGYPALLAREFVAGRSYKSDERPRQTADREAGRAAIVDALALGRGRLGVALTMTAEQRAELVAEGSADGLDACLCLVQAAWAAGRADHGLPAEVDPIEGWIVTAMPSFGA